MKKDDTRLDAIQKIIDTLNSNLDLDKDVKEKLYLSRKIAVSKMRGKQHYISSKIKNYIRFIGGGVAILAMSAFVFNYVSFSDGRTKVENAYQSFTDNINSNNNTKSTDGANKF